MCMIMIALSQANQRSMQQQRARTHTHTHRDNLKGTSGTVHSRSQSSQCGSCYFSITEQLPLIRMQYRANSDMIGFGIMFFFWRNELRQIT